MKLKHLTALLLAATSMTACVTDGGSSDSSDGGIFAPIDETGFADATPASACEAFCAATADCPPGESGSLEACQTECEAALASGERTASRLAACTDAHLSACPDVEFAACVTPGPAGDGLRVGLALVKPSCARQVGCCPNGDFESEQECVSLLTAFIGGFFGEALEKGWVTLDQSAANVCLSAITELTTSAACDESIADINENLETVEACQTMFQPQQGAGDVCGDTEGLSSDMVCQGNMVCIRSAEGPPVCAVGQAEGDECDFSGSMQCAQSLVCADGECIAPKADGEACFAETMCQSENCVEGVCAPEGPAMCNDADGIR